MFNVKRTLVEQLERSVGSTIYNRLYVIDNGREDDCLQDATYACAWFVSNVLVAGNIIHSTEINVLRLVGLLRESCTNDLVYELPVDSVIDPGDVIVWGAMIFEGDPQPHHHVGMAVSSQEAVSTSCTAHCVVKHLITRECGPSRPIVAIFRPNWQKVSARLWERMYSRKGARL